MESLKIIQIPEGYQIDTEKSNDRQIVLNKIYDNKVRSWEEYCKKMEGKDSYFIEDSYYTSVSSQFRHVPIVTEFKDKEEAEAFAAFSKLRKFRRDWVGEWKPDYKNCSEPKFAIVTSENEITKQVENYTVNNSMSFPTEKMRDEFFDTFKDLLDQAKTLL